MSALFVTGTDTGVGKTLVACSLIHALRQHGGSVAAMKPLASGATPDADGVLRNEDVEALLASAPDTPRELVNPYCFAQPTAPEIAAGASATVVRLAPMLAALDALVTSHDHVVVEGVGGWESPLSAELMQADLCRGRAVPVLLVVGLRLGCINHARLTLRAIRGDGLDCRGWIASAVDPAFSDGPRNTALLERDLDVPLLGVLPHSTPADPAVLSRHIDVTALLAADASVFP